MTGLADVLHTLIDVAAGRRNLSPADADQLHEKADQPAAVPVADAGPPEPGPDAAPEA